MILLKKNAIQIKKKMSKLTTPEPFEFTNRDRFLTEMVAKISAPPRSIDILGRR